MNKTLDYYFAIFTLIQYFHVVLFTYYWLTDPLLFGRNLKLLILGNFGFDEMTKDEMNSYVFTQLCYSIFFRLKQTNMKCSQEWIDRHGTCAICF